MRFPAFTESSNSWSDWTEESISVAEQLGVHHEALRSWGRQDEADRGERVGRPTSEMVGENKQLRKRVAELERINAVLRDPSAYFASEIGQTRR